MNSAISARYPQSTRRPPGFSNASAMRNRPVPQFGFCEFMPQADKPKEGKPCIFTRAFRTVIQTMKDCWHYFTSFFKDTPNNSKNPDSKTQP
jgi:hypothetical protein